MTITISIIIPTCNRNDLLQKCLEGLIHSIEATGTNLYEVIVTDDSKNNVAEELILKKFNWVKWVAGPKQGPAANRNHGAKLAQGGWLLFIDDDCLPQKQWLSSYMTAIIENDNILVLEGRTVADRIKQRFDEEAPINMYGNKLWSCNFAIKKTFFRELGGFDESFLYAAMEDIDFHKRVKQHTSVVFIAQALVIHPWRRVKPFKAFFKHLKSHSYFAKKYNLKYNLNFRLSRIKIFIGAIFFYFKELLSFSMKGWPIYIEKCLLNFCLIFI